jgi:hypothetical protein
MRRVSGAMQEWLERRARLHGERQFHLERAAAEFRALGLSPHEAKRKARVRFGNRRHCRIALREIGGDVRGLASLLRAYRVGASAWLQPALLLAGIVLMFFLSPAPRALLEGVIGTPLSGEEREQVFLAAEGGTASERAISERDFDRLRTLATLSGVERYERVYARGRAAQGVTLAAIQAQVRARTGNRSIWAGWMFSETRIVTGPAKVVWLLMSFYIVLALRGCMHFRDQGVWFGYGLVVALLHAAASVTAWAFAIQIWNRAPLSTAGTTGVIFSLLLATYLLIAVVQYRYWWTDLRQRCPVCLDRLLLPVTEGAASRVLLGSAITQSVCAHGHGVLVESRWSRRFRPQEAPFLGFVRV